MTPEEKRQTARKSAGTFYVSGKSYHTPLPPELADWYVYCSDGGHCLICLLDQFYTPEDDDLISGSIPIPVKAVMRSYRIERDWIIVSGLEYSETLGLITQAEDDEY